MSTALDPFGQGAISENQTNRDRRERRREDRRDEKERRREQRRRRKDRRN